MHQAGPQSGSIICDHSMITTPPPRLTPDHTGDPMADLSDKALAVFAFAIYHRLQTGERVTGVVGRDGAGHQADSEGVAELEKQGLAKWAGDRIEFTPEGESQMDGLFAALRTAAGRSS